jgi:hypothetical protein
VFFCLHFTSACFASSNQSTTHQLRCCQMCALCGERNSTRHGSPYIVYGTLPGVAHFGSCCACAAMSCLRSHSICCSSCSLLTSRSAGCSGHVDFVSCWRAPHAAAASEHSHRCCTCHMWHLHSPLAPLPVELFTRGGGAPVSALTQGQL